jgi:hypothetical protein
VPVVLGATTVQVLLAGVPAAPDLTGSTVNVCLPGLSDEYVFGDVQEPNLLESSEQRKPAPDVPEVKPKLAVVAVVVEPFAGPDVINTSSFRLLPPGPRCSATRRDRRRWLRRAFLRTAGSIA